MLMETKIFNERIKSGYPKVLINNGNNEINLPWFAKDLIEKLLPEMFSGNESCFLWNFHIKAISCYKEEIYTKEKDKFVQHKFKHENFDTLWQVNFKLPNGTKMKAEIKNEVWFKENEEHEISPYAFLFDAPLACGYMYSKVSFSKAE
jgi:hypothetical protein